MDSLRFKCVSFASNLFNELGFKLHRSYSVYLAVDIVITLNQPDVLNLGPDFHH